MKLKKWWPIVVVEEFHLHEVSLMPDGQVGIGGRPMKYRRVGFWGCTWAYVKAWYFRTGRWLVARLP